MYAERLGTERALAMNPYATLAAAGVTLAFGSDSPVTPLDPWGGVRAAVHHQVAEQRCRRRLRSTRTPVVAGGPLGIDDTGWLAPGAPATFAVWDAPSLDDAVERTPACLRTVSTAAPSSRPRDGLLLRDDDPQRDVDDLADAEQAEQDEAHPDQAGAQPEPFGERGADAADDLAVARTHE